MNASRNATEATTDLRFVLMLAELRASMAPRASSSFSTVLKRRRLHLKAKFESGTSCSCFKDLNQSRSTWGQPAPPHRAPLVHGGAHRAVAAQVDVESGFSYYGFKC